MSNSGTGDGAAADAEILTISDDEVADLSVVGATDAERAEAARIVAACRTIVEKQEGHLARARQALEDALAAQEGLN